MPAPFFRGPNHVVKNNTGMITVQVVKDKRPTGRTSNSELFTPNSELPTLKLSLYFKNLNFQITPTNASKKLKPKIPSRKLIKNHGDTGRTSHVVLSKKDLILILNGHSFTTISPWATG